MESKCQTGAARWPLATDREPGIWIRPRTIRYIWIHSDMDSNERAMVLRCSGTEARSDDIPGEEERAKKLKLNLDEPTLNQFHVRWVSAINRYEFVRPADPELRLQTMFSDVGSFDQRIDKMRILIA